MQTHTIFLIHTHRRSSLTSERAVKTGCPENIRTQIGADVPQDHHDRTAGSVGSVKERSPEIQPRSAVVFCYAAFCFLRPGLFKRSSMALFVRRLADFLFPTDSFRVFIVAFSSCPYNEVKSGYKKEDCLVT